jgi:hypothetical protein
MIHCAHDPGLALLLAEGEGWREPEASPAAIRLAMLAVFALNAVTLLLIALS